VKKNSKNASKGAKSEARSKDEIWVAAANKNAGRSYELVRKLEVGIQLHGYEVKSIREGKANLKESYVRENSGEMFLVGCHISQYSHATADSYDPVRERKLLLKKQEIEELKSSIQRKGLTVIPLKIYFKGRLCKLEIATARGKKLHDRRDDLKKKDADRHIERALKIHS